MDDVANERSSTAAAGDLIGESGQDAAGDGLVAGGSGFGPDVKVLVAGDIQKLLEEFLHLPGGLGVDGEGTEGFEAEIVAFGVVERAHEDEKIRDALAEDFGAFLLDAFFGFEQEAARLGEGGDEGGGTDAAEFLRGEEHAGVARMDGKAKHAASGRGDVAGGIVGGSEVAQELFGAGEGFFLRPVDPAETRKITHSGGFEGKDGLGQVEALDFREFDRRTLDMVAFGPEAQTNSRRGAAGAAGALIGRGAADLFDHERVDAAVGIVAGHAGQSGIDHHGHAVDGEGRFGHIGGDDDLALRGAGHGLVLLGGGEFAMEGQDGAAGACAVGEFADGALDFIRTRHEDKDVAVGAVEVFPHGLNREVPGRFVAGFVAEVFDLNGKNPAFRNEGLAGGEVFFDLAAVQRGGHDDDFEIGPGGFLEIEGAGQTDVAVEVAFVKLVEDYSGNVPQTRVGDHLPQEDAFRDEKDAGGGGGNIVQPDAIADFTAERDAAFLGHAFGQHAGGQAARLQDDAAAVT